MAGSIQVPVNIEDKTVLKRFLTDLVTGLASNPYYSGSVTAQNEVIVQALQANPNLDFLNLVSKLNELRSNILTYVEENVETIILQNQEDIALIAEQFGTFYDQALAASWYGLSVKAGGAIAGLEVGSLDPSVTTPGDESSYFRVIADNFVVGRAYEDLTVSEKNYLTANGLPNFGTVYNNITKQPIPAIAITWDSAANTYKHYFNGIVNFSNINTGYTEGGNTVINGGQILTNSITANKIDATNLIARNIIVPGVNGGNPLFSASNDKVVISNLKVVGTASLPGISKFTSFNMPSVSVPYSVNGNNSTFCTLLSTYINKPFECNYWGIQIVSSCSSQTNTSVSRDFNCHIFINGTDIASLGSSGPYSVDITVNSGLDSIQDSYVLLEIKGKGYNTSNTQTVRGTTTVFTCVNS